MDKSIKVVLAHAGVLDINRGCVALTLSIMYILHKISINRKVEIAIYLSNSGLGEEGDYTINVNGESINYKVWNYIRTNGLKNKISYCLHYKKIKNNHVFLNNVDYILNIGRGDSYSDIYGIDRFNYTETINELARKYKIKYCFLPQTIGPFENKNILEIAKQSLGCSAMVMARDRQSYNCVKSLCPNQNNVREYIDVAFFLPYKKTIFDTSFIHVGLNISAFMLMGGYTGDNQFELVIDYDVLIRRIIDYFLSIDNVKLHLIGHVESGERFIESDYVACRDLYYEYNNPKLVLADFFLGPIEAKNYISGMDFFMGARMHATIAAFSSGVPVVPMAYSRKFNGLFEDTLNYFHMVDMKKQNEEEILISIKDSFLKRNELKKEVDIQNSTTIRSRGAMFEQDLEKLLGIC